MVFDRWSTHRSIRDLRTAFEAIGLLASPRGIVLSRINQERTRILLFPHLFALHRWLYFWTLERSPVPLNSASACAVKPQNPPQILCFLIMACGMNTVMQHSARSTVRQEYVQIHFIVNGVKRSTFPAKASESTYLMCLGHFEHASQLVEQEKSTIPELLRDNLVTSTLWWSSHWKIHRAWSQHGRFRRHALDSLLGTLPCHLTA